MADFLSLSVKNDHERKKKSKSNRIKSDPHWKRPFSIFFADTSEYIIFSFRDGGAL